MSSHTKSHIVHLLPTVHVVPVEKEDLVDEEHITYPASCQKKEGKRQTSNIVSSNAHHQAEEHSI